MSRRSPDVELIASLLCSRDSTGIDQWRTKKTKWGLVYFVPGPTVGGKVLHATITVRKTPKYYWVELWLGDLDCCLPEAYAFKAGLEKAARELFAFGTGQDDPFDRLLQEPALSLPSCAYGCAGDGFRSARFQNVTKEFVEKFMILTAMLYSRTNQLYRERHGSWTKEDWLRFSYEGWQEPALVSAG